MSQPQLIITLYVEFKYICFLIIRFDHEVPEDIINEYAGVLLQAQEVKAKNYQTKFILWRVTILGLC